MDNNMLFYRWLGPNTINSPLEQFEVIPFVGLNAPILGVINITLTNLAFYCLLVVVLLLGLHLFALNNLKIVPNKWSISLESSYASIETMVKEQIGISKEVYIPFIYSLFFFLLLSNLTGNVPYSFTIATSAIVSLGLSFTIFIGVTLLSLQIHKLHFFSYFVPSGTPLILVPLLVLIEAISYIARAFSLGVRLFANMVAGHTLLVILSGFLYPMIFSSGKLMSIISILPITIFIALIGLEIAVAVIQAYVFSILTCIYLKDAIYLH